MFGQASISDYYRQLQDNVRSEVLRETEEQILGTDVEELAQYIYEKYALSPIEIDSERETSWDLEDYLQDIPEQRRESFYSGQGTLHDFQCQRAIVEVPILPNKDLQTISRLQGSTYSMSYSDSDFRWGANAISRSFETKGYQLQMDERSIANEVKRVLQTIQDTIHWKNESILKENKELLGHAKFHIQQRRGALEQNKERLAALTKTIDIPLKKKSSAGAQVIRVSQTPLVQRVKPKPTLPEQYVLDAERVKDIITLLDNQARSFEKTPKVFNSLGEEALRDILLSNLNSVFEGGATGETFSKNGKTDIHLNIAKGNILICECKIWGGQALYAETINQLRGYLTWRQNYGIVITFVRNKDFTKTLTDSEAAIKAHPSYLSGFKKIDDTHFVSNHKIDDDEKVVEIHHLFYHLFS